MEFSRTRLDFRRPVSSYSKVRSIVSSAIRNRALFYRPIPRQPFLLDIGPGPNLSQDFYNIDFEWRPGIDRCLDITKGLGLPPNSVRGVFTEHCFEHIPPCSLVEVLGELHRAMLPGAWVRIIMPDLELYARRYVESIDNGGNSLPHSDLKVAGFSAPAVPLNNVIREHGHQFVYDFPLLSQILEQRGFKSISSCRFKEGHDPELLRDSESRACESFYVEACK